MSDNPFYAAARNPVKEGNHGGHDQASLPSVAAASAADVSVGGLVGSFP
jgi:hypothetical protein